MPSSRRGGGLSGEILGGPWDQRAGDGGPTPVVEVVAEELGGEEGGCGILSGVASREEVGPPRGVGRGNGGRDLVDDVPLRIKPKAQREGEAKEAWKDEGEGEAYARTVSGKATRNTQLSPPHPRALPPTLPPFGFNVPPSRAVRPPR